MKLEICRWPESVLAEKARNIDEVTPELQELIENMVETMYEDEGVGLAAPQVGESIRLICVDQTGPKERGDLMVMINPEITDCEGSVDSEEGCLSCPEFTGKVKRSEKITVKALDRDGKEMCMDAEGYLAVIIQHEVDHLDGVTIVDRSSNLKKAMYRKKARKWAREDA